MEALKEVHWDFANEASKYKMLHKIMQVLNTSMALMDTAAVVFNERAENDGAGEEAHCHRLAGAPSRP